MTGINSAPARDSWEPLAGSAQAVVLEILVHGPLPRIELAARLGLSGPSLTRITKPMLDSGLLVEKDVVSPTGTGRPSIPLDILPDLHHYVGIKLTFDGVFVVVTDQRGTVLVERDEALDSTDVPRVVDQIGRIVTSLTESDTRIRAVGVALGGLTIDRRWVSRAPFLGWADVPLAELVAERTGLPAWVENDVRALTQAEHWFGDGREHRSFALVTVGAGIGLGLVANGAVLTGAHSTAGSIGHQRLGNVDAELRDAVCDLGHHGCARALLSSGAIVAAATRALGRPTGYDEVLELATAGDPAATRVVDQAAQALGVLVADIVNVFDPDVVLLSGEGVGIATVGNRALGDALARTKHWSTPMPVVLVQPFRFVEWARGAAAVAIQMHALGR